MRAIIVLILLSMTLITESFAQTTAQPATAPAAATQPAPQAMDPETELPTADEPVVVREPIKTGFVFNPNITLSSRKLQDNQGAASGKMRTLQLDSRVGYVFDFGLFVGGQLNTGFGSEQSGGAANDTDINYYSVGPSVGYSDKYTGLFLNATYHVMGRYDRSSAGKFEEVTGYQVDLGYPVKVSDNVQLGPQLSLKRIDLKDNTTGTPDLKIKELTPYFGLWLYF